MVSGRTAPPSGILGDAAQGLTLAIDASTYVGTVALLRDGAVVAACEAAMRGEHEERLMPAVLATLADADVAPSRLARVVCGAGPGSFTSLRIAAGIAKGIAHGAGIPLYAVSSPALIVAGAEPLLAPGEYVAVLDAMRSERYVQRVQVNADGRIVIVGELRILTPDQVTAEGLSSVGPLEPGALKPHARGVARLLSVALAAGPVNLESWEPSYGRLAEAQVKWEAAHGRPLQA